MGRKYPCKELRIRSYLLPKTSNYSCSTRTEKIYDELSKELRKLFLSGVIISVEYSIGLVQYMVKARNKRITDYKFITQMRGNYKTNKQQRRGITELTTF